MLINAIFSLNIIWLRDRMCCHSQELAEPRARSLLRPRRRVLIRSHSGRHRRRHGLSVAPPTIGRKSKAASTFHPRFPGTNSAAIWKWTIPHEPKRAVSRTSLTRDEVRSVWQKSPPPAATNQVAGIDTKRLRESTKDPDCGRAFGQLNVADIAGAQPGAICQLLLREALGVTRLPQISCQNRHEIHPLIGRLISSIFPRSILLIRLPG